jgi:3-oxoadipate enol-lactonase
MGAAVDLNFRWDGPPDRPVLVLSHALGLSMAMWEPQMARLSRQFRVLRYDHRGHGASPVPPGPYAIAELGIDLVKLVDRLKLERFSFCGLSLGGMVGMWFAANLPERIHRLVLCCTAARMPRPQDYPARAERVRREGLEPIADAVLGRWFSPEFSSPHQETVSRIRSLFLATDPEGYAATCEALGEMDLRHDLRRISAEPLIIAGGADQATPLAQAEEIAGKIPGSKLVVIDGAAHLANLEQPGRLTDLILEALRPSGA